MPTTQQVLDSHIAAIDSGDMTSILSDYAADAVLLTPEGTFRGHEEIRPVIQRVLDDVFSTCTHFQMLQKNVEGEIAYIVWSAESQKFSVPLATDTFVMRDGKIVVQTFAAKMVGKG